MADIFMGATLGENLRLGNNRGDNHLRRHELSGAEIRARMQIVICSTLTKRRPRLLTLRRGSAGFDCFPTKGTS
jgi:hypothetical protein